MNVIRLGGLITTPDIRRRDVRFVFDITGHAQRFDCSVA